MQITKNHSQTINHMISLISTLYVAFATVVQTIIHYSQSIKMVYPVSGSLILLRKGNKKQAYSFQIKSRQQKMNCKYVIVVK